MTTRGIAVGAGAASEGTPLVGTGSGAVGAAEAVEMQETARTLPSSLKGSPGSCDTVEQDAGAATGAATDEESARSPVGAEEGRPLPNPPAASRAGASEADAGAPPDTDAPQDAGALPDTDAPPNAGALSDAGVLPNAGALPGAGALSGAGAGTETVAQSAAAAAAVRAACTEGSAV